MASAEVVDVTRVAMPREAIAASASAMLRRFVIMTFSLVF